MIGYSDFLEEVRGKRIKSVQLQEGAGGSTEIRARTSDDKELRTTATYLDRGLIGDLINNNVKFDVKPREEPSFLLSILASWGPILLLTARKDLLQDQVTELSEKSLDLSKNLTNLQQKAEQAKAEVKEHSQKITSRLEKERSDFEIVRAKRRTELEEYDNVLKNESARLDSVDSQLLTRTQQLNDREKSLSAISDALVVKEQQLNGRERSIEDERVNNLKDLTVRKDSLLEEIRNLESKVQIIAEQIIKKQEFLVSQDKESEEYRQQAMSLTAISEDKMKRIEKVAQNQKEREEQLNLREASLRELDKELNKRKVQLDDRQATIASH